jgi:hypothetical protein
VQVAAADRRDPADRKTSAATRILSNVLRVIDKISVGGLPWVIDCAPQEFRALLGQDS